MPFPAPPDPFFSVAVNDLTMGPTLCALCAGFEGGKWRAEHLADHAMEWLPEFCLSAEELAELTPGNALRMIRKAAKLVYQTDKYKLRGEFGELFLHIALRQVNSPHEKLTPPWLYSRAINGSKDYIAIWRRTDLQDARASSMGSI